MRANVGVNMPAAVVAPGAAAQAVAEAVVAAAAEVTDAVAVVVASAAAAPVGGPVVIFISGWFEWFELLLQPDSVILSQRCLFYYLNLIIRIVFYKLCDYSLIMLFQKVIK